ncbi:MAG: C2H2-type zinc finger protein [Oscillospiraceae bacterium]|nr:C2H2-type zinc finger protein [Oscillospiraceae bacterium]
MKKYYATKPVRFDKEYAIGEEIPAEVIDTRSLGRLEKLGKVRCVDTENAPFTEEKCVSLFERILGIEHENEPPTIEERIETCKAAVDIIRGDLPESGGNAGGQTDNQDEEEFICPVCEKKCASKAGLVSHMANKHPDYQGELKLDDENTEKSESGGNAGG